MNLSSPSKRKSLSQLPLPHVSAITPNSGRRHSANFTIKTQGYNLDYNPFLSPVASTMSNPQGEVLNITSPSSGANIVRSLSTTHAGGIQPSASFFRPS